MEEKQVPENTASQPLSAEYKIENTAQPSQQNPDQSINRKYLLTEVHKIGAARLAGFLYWTNFAAIIFLLVGFVSPGWLTFSATHFRYFSESVYRSSDESDSTSQWVYQDYSLFYITQCTTNEDYRRDVYYHTCETLSYRTVDHLYRNRNYRYSKMKIGEKEVVGDDTFTFRGAGIVMSSSEITRMQALYTTGILFSIFTFYIWWCYRSEIANGIFSSFNMLKWLVMFAMSLIACITVLVPVIIFAQLRGQIFTSNSDYLETSLGLVFAGFGGGFMTLMTIVVFMQLICCRTPGTYICSCTDEPGNSDPVVDE